MYSDEQIEQQAEIYLKLRPFIRRLGRRIVWNPQSDIIFAPTFEQFLKTETAPVFIQQTGSSLHRLNECTCDICNELRAQESGTVHINMATR